MILQINEEIPKNVYIKKAFAILSLQRLQYAIFYNRPII